MQDAISATRLYSIYSGMKQRCYNCHNSHYHSYGARGIAICDEWLGDNGLQNFIQWALANGYNENLTIDRIDNDKSYSPDNCEWVTRSYNSAKGNLNIEHILSTGKVFQKNIQESESSDFMLPLKYRLKSAIAQSGWTITAVVEVLNDRHNTSLSVQNFSSKMIRGTLKYSEVEEVLDIIGYDIVWKKRS